jgi:hypothetical protein
VHASSPVYDETVVVPFDQPTVSLQVPVGTLYLEATGRGTVNGALVPTYYGDLLVPLQRGDAKDVVITMFPAGAMDVTVIISPERLKQLSLALVSFHAQAPRTDESPVFGTKLAAGHVARVLPSGDYTYSAVVSFDGGESFEGVGPTSNVLTINQGEIFTATLDLSSIN